MVAINGEKWVDDGMILTIRYLFLARRQRWHERGHRCHVPTPDMWQRRNKMLNIPGWTRKFGNVIAYRPGKKSLLEHKGGEAGEKLPGRSWDGGSGRATASKNAWLLSPALLAERCIYGKFDS